MIKVIIRFGLHGKKGVVLENLNIGFMGYSSSLPNTLLAPSISHSKANVIESSAHLIFRSVCYSNQSYIYVDPNAMESSTHLISDPCVIQINLIFM